MSLFNSVSTITQIFQIFFSSTKTDQAVLNDIFLQGFKNVRNMAGGYLAWIEKTFPVTMKEPTKIEEKPKEEL